ncbi:MAG: hypothetical protein ACLFU8_12585 [Anaerolineales bacterium]
MYTKKFKRERSVLVIALLLIFSLLLAACGSMAEDTPTATPEESPPATPGEEELVTVERLEVLYLESFPLQIQILISGYLADGCTTIEEIVQGSNLEENRYWIDIQASRDPDAVCTQATVPFEESVALDVYGLPAGTYTVDVEEQSTTFTLDVDNVLPPEEGVAPVENVNVAVEEEEAVVEVAGNLPDGCTEIDAVNRRYDPAAKTFFVEITTLRPTDLECTQALVPYQEEITLDLTGLEEGAYTVNVNDVTNTFTLAEGEDGEDGEGADGDVLVREALLDSMDLQVLESFPVQVNISVRGNFRDGCSEFGPVQQKTDVEARTLNVEVLTTRPADAVCTQALVPFEETFPLNVEGLPAGTYDVLVNGIPGELVLGQDNVAP